jgi:hypothetical protein
MSNTIFLQEAQLNNLYVLLLIGRASPWDHLKYECWYVGEWNHANERKMSMNWF